MVTQPLIALDIGATKIACAIGLPRERAAGFELLGSSLVPYAAAPETWLADPLTVSRAIERALEDAAASADIHRALVAVSHPALASERVQVAIDLADEPVTVRAQDVDRLQRRALDHVLGVDRSALMVERLGCTGNGFDGVRDPRGLSATRLAGAFHIVTIPVAARRALVQVVESAGLEIAKLLYALPASLAASVADDTALQRQRVLVIDVGGMTADLGLFAEGILLASTTAPWGGAHLAAAIARELHVTLEQAMTWSLEGMTCRKPEVRTLIERQWQTLPSAVEPLLHDQPRPDRALVSGRGALIDGFVEWAEQATGLPTSLCRSARTTTHQDLARQVGLSTAIGVLELATRSPATPPPTSSRFLNRLLEQTRSILTEYF